ncbi:MAG: penicillin-binding protein [Candidatus Sumerlaeia bacterium]
MLKKHYRLRILFILGWLVVGFIVIQGRLYYIQVVKHEYYRNKAEQHQIKQILLTPTRGDIVDSEGNILATNLSRLSLYVFPKYMSDAQKRNVAQSAGRIVKKSPEQLAQMLRNESPVAIGRMLDHASASLLNSTLADLGMTRRQFWFTRENERIYPNGLAAPVIGYCAPTPYGDNEGLAGIEKFYDDKLKGRADKWWAPRSATNYLLETVDSQTILDTYGDRIHLTLHAGLQDEVETLLREQVNQYNADTGVAIVMDVKTGAVRAMASIPTFDPNAYERYPDGFRRNIAVTDPIEIGSVMKIITASIVIDTGAVTPDTLIDCEGGVTVIRGRVIRDAPGHKLYVAPFHDVFAWSSNVGFCKAAQPIPKSLYFDYLWRFGLGQKTGIDLTEDGAGILHPLSKWSDYSMTSLPMGYEAALTPLQTATAVAAVANGGKRMTPYLVERITRPGGEVVWEHVPHVAAEVCSPATAAAVLTMMRQTVEHGTGEKAKIPGYSMGGKTGTTQKSNVFTHREYISGFACVLPLSDPQIVIYAYINNPKGAKYGGEVAAPLVRKIALASVKFLHIPPDEPFEELAQEQSGLYRQIVTKLDAPSAPPAEPAAPAPAQADAADGPTDPDQPVMPNLAGLTLKEALHVLEPLHLQVTVIGAGVVVDQNPKAQSTVKQGSLCTLTLDRAAVSGRGIVRQTAQAVR